MGVQWERRCISVDQDFYFLCCSLFCIVHHLELLHEGFRAFLEVREDSLIEYEIATFFGFRSDTERIYSCIHVQKHNASAYIRQVYTSGGWDPGI